MRIRENLLPTTRVRVFAEDMRFSRKVVLLDKFGREYEVEKHPIIYQADWKNTITDDGRINAIYNTFNFTGGTPWQAVAGGVGSGSSNPTDPTQVRLANELIADTERKTLTNTDDVEPFVTADIESDILGSNRKLLETKFVYETDDPNNGSTFNEYGLFSTVTLPGTPTTQSGFMLARFVAASGFPKNEFARVTVIWEFRA